MNPALKQPRSSDAKIGIAMARLKVGLDGQSTPDCEWYDGILEDALNELENAKDSCGK